MAASLTACGGGAKETTAAATTAEEKAEDTTAAESKDETSAEAAETEAAKEAAGGKLVMATNAEFPPYEYHDGDAIVGIDAEIAKAIADELGMELEIEDIAFDSIIPEIVSGKADMGLAGMTVTEAVSYTHLLRRWSPPCPMRTGRPPRRSWQRRRHFWPDWKRRLRRRKNPITG